MLSAANAEKTPLPDTGFQGKVFKVKVRERGWGM